MKLRANDRILFIGDSITDCGRSFNNDEDLGLGYVFLAGNLLLGKVPHLHLKVFNRGIGGNKLLDLEKRWETDCLAVNPDILTVFIGINDIWHNRTNGTPIDQEYLNDFDRRYRQLLVQMTEQNPAIQLILIQPFVLPILEDRLAWKNELNLMNQIIANIANDFKAELIPLSDHFEQLLTESDPLEFTVEDGVHPTPVGHGVIANQWLNRINF